MKLIDRYILTKTLWPLIATVSVALIALLMERLVRLLDLVVNKGGPFGLVLRMIGNLVPHYLGLALPAAFFLGVLLAVSRLSSESELDALHASGTGAHRLLAPLMGLALFLAVLAVVIVGYLQPLTRYGYRALVYVVTETAWDAALERGAFFSGFGNITITVEDIGEGGRSLYGIFVHEERPQGGSITTTAAAGRVVRSPADQTLILELEQGLRIDAGDPTRKATVLSFDRLQLPLNAALAPGPFRHRGDSEREMTLTELWRALDRPPEASSRAEIETELHSRLARIVSYLMLPLLAYPLGCSSRRTQRGTGLVAGILLVVLFHYLLQLGEDIGGTGTVSPWLSVWLPVLCYFLFSIWAFVAAATRPGHNAVDSVLGYAEDLARRLWSLLRRRKVSA